MKIKQTSIHFFTFSKYLTQVLSAVSQAVGALRRGDLLQTFVLWQMRLVVELWDSRMLHGPGNRQDALLTTEFLPVMKNMVDVALDNWIKGEENGAIVVIYGRI